MTLASKQTNVFCIAIDTHNLYWATADLPNAGAVNRIPLTGGPFSTISTTTSAPWPCSMAVSDMFVYWADGSTGSVLRARIRGGVAQTIAANVQANFIAIDALSAYWSGQFAYPSKVPLAGGVVTKLAADSYSATGIALDAKSLYWTTRGPGGGQGTVQRVPLAGGLPITLQSGEDDPEGIAVDGTGVYFTTYGAGTIRRVSLDGGAVSTLATEQFNPTVIAVDETSVYWSTAFAVQKMAKAGGVVTTLADTKAFDIKVDATSVYWTDGGAVMKLTPK